MPSCKKYDEYDVNDVNETYDEENDVFTVDIDEDGNPYINADLFNLGCDRERVSWIDSANSDIVELYKIMIHYRDHLSSSHIFEKITFNKFLIFVANNSFKLS